MTISVYTCNIYNTLTKYIVLCAGSDWSCRFCGLPVSVSMVSATISSLESELSAVLETDYSVATLQAFMASHSHQLHSKHYLNLLGSGSFFVTIPYYSFSAQKHMLTILSEQKNMNRAAAQKIVRLAKSIKVSGVVIRSNPNQQ